MALYRELPAWPVLREHLACVWYREVSPDHPSRAVRILPDACLDLVWPAGRGLFVAGPDTGPKLAELAPGTVMVGARFRPGLAADLLRVPIAGLRDVQPPLAGLWGEDDAERLAHSAAAGSAPDMLAELQRALQSRLPRTRPEPWLPAALDWARAARPGGLLRLAGAVGIGERQLRRRFEDRFGYGPSTLRRVLRLQRLLRLAPGGLPLAELAAAAGYADQAHMTRECQRLAGLTPARLALWATSPG